MEQPADRDLLRELVVDPDSLACLGYVDADGSFAQELQRRRVGQHLPVHAERKHHARGTAFTSSCTSAGWMPGERRVPVSAQSQSRPPPG